MGGIRTEGDGGGLYSGTVLSAEDSLRLETVRERVRQKLDIYRRDTNKTGGHSGQTPATRNPKAPGKGAPAETTDCHSLTYRLDTDT